MYERNHNFVCDQSVTRMARGKHVTESSPLGVPTKRSKGLLKTEEAFLQDVNKSVMTEEERTRAE